jgi:tetratricopeptide (TPR) repeat protein
MVHMPSHIDVRLGQWQQAIAANEKATAAETAYRDRSPQQDFYRIYMAHNHHMLAFAAMMQGESARSTRVIRQMLAEIPDKWRKANAPFVDGMFSMPYELHLRFGRWDEMLAEPEPGEHFPITGTMRHFARGVAYAAKKDVHEARAEQQVFRAAKDALPEEAMFVQNPAAAVFAVADKVLEGEILYREGKVDEAIAELREGVQLEEALRYIEPPDWIQPVRHVLGASLMDARRFAEAEEVYRADLEVHPHNGWALFGLAESLRLQQKEDEAADVQARFAKAWEHADVKLTSSCYCLPGK